MDVQKVIDAMLADLALVSLYSQRGFPTEEFSELCERLNDGGWPVDRESPYLIEDDQHVKIAHALLSELILTALARKPEPRRDHASSGPADLPTRA